MYQLLAIETSCWVLGGTSL